MERVITIMQNPRQYKIPDWFLNRQKDIKDGKYSQVGEIACTLFVTQACVCLVLKDFLPTSAYFGFRFLPTILRASYVKTLKG